MDPKKINEVRKSVRDVYSDLAKGHRNMLVSDETFSKCAGYTDQQLFDIPEESCMCLGCGNPLQFVALKSGEVVLDLGCGAGFDCFLAARAVGPKGRIIGVDMTTEMIEKAKKNLHARGYGNVIFKLGEIERLPVGSETVDVIVSNCVINMSPEKLRVFQEAHRVLKPGGRLAIADVVAIAPLPPEIHSDVDCIAECVWGAATVEEMEQVLASSGFTNIHVRIEEKSRDLVSQWVPGSGLENYILAAMIKAVKPPVKK